MSNTARIRTLAILSMLFNAVVTGIAISEALDPSETALWLSWGYLQKGACLLSIATFWPLFRMSMQTFFETVLDEEEPEYDFDSRVNACSLHAELDRVTSNPRMPKV